MHSDLLITWRLLLTFESLNRQIVLEKQKFDISDNSLFSVCHAPPSFTKQAKNEIKKWWCSAKSSAVRNNRNIAWDGHCAAGSPEEGWEGPGCPREQRICESSLWAGTALGSGVNVTLPVRYIRMPRSTEQKIQAIRTGSSFHFLPMSASSISSCSTLLARSFPASVFSHPVQNCTSLFRKRRDPAFSWDFLL